jgi:hypothetical protein
MPTGEVSRLAENGAIPTVQTLGVRLDEILRRMAGGS